MTVDRRQEVDRAIDEVLATMVEGEPRRVNAASVRQAMGERRRSSLPIWSAVAAVLVVALGVALKDRAPLAKPPLSAARSAEAPGPSEARPAASKGPTPVTPGASATSKRVHVQTTTENPYEGLPRLTIASIDLPEPLSTSRLAADPIQIPSIDITPLSVSNLWNEQEHK